MFTKRLIAALLDQIAMLTITVEALSAEANRYSRGHEIEDILKSAKMNMLRACSNLSDLERLIAKEEQDEREAENAQTA